MRTSGRHWYDSRRPLPEECRPSLRRLEPVPHVVGQHAVLDEHVARRGASLVVDLERAPLEVHRPVVDERHERARDELAHAARVDRGLLQDGVGLEPVSARLVEEDARPSRPRARSGARRSARDAPRASSAPVAPPCVAIAAHVFVGRRPRTPTVFAIGSKPVCIPVSPLATQITFIRVRTRSSLAYVPVGVRDEDAAARVAERPPSPGLTADPVERAASSARLEQLDAALLRRRRSGSTSARTWWAASSPSATGVVVALRRSARSTRRCARPRAGRAR